MSLKKKFPASERFIFQMQYFSNTSLLTRTHDNDTVIETVMVHFPNFITGVYNEPYGLQ